MLNIFLFEIVDSFRPDTQSGNLESSLRRAKKSLTTSFNQLLKRDGRENDSAERETSEEVNQTTQMPR